MTSTDNSSSAQPSDLADVPSAGAVFGPIEACAARDKLVARALLGDEKALKFLIDAFPQDLPARVVTAFRDDELQRFGRWLVAEYPNLSIRKAARILVAAGRKRLTKNASPIGHHHPFDVLELEDRKAIEQFVDGLAAFSPSWPQITKMREILTR